MSPNLAALFYLAFIAWLFWRDLRQRPGVSAAIWLPFFWITISASRFVSQWLEIFGVNIAGTTVEEGSPLDAVIFIILIIGGVAVLNKRRVSVGEFVRNNRWVAIYLIFCLIATVWSDYTFVAFKRWIKLFGQPVMVLILLTEPDPVESFVRLMKRCAYVLVPISFLFIKYFEQYGRGWDPWSGMAFNTGITTDKNVLGCDCLILGLFFFWQFVRAWRWEKGRERRNELILSAFFFLTIVNLLRLAHSSSSLITMILGAGVIVFLGIPAVNKKRLGFYILAGVAIVAVAEGIFGASNHLFQILGKDPTLTGRTEIWKVLLKWNLNPLIGTGFESFWLGERREEMARIFWWGPNEAHNGYLETYINMGLAGVALTLAMILAAYGKAKAALFTDFNFGRFRLAYLAAFLIYNLTEAAFRTHAFPFFMFFLVAMDFPRPAQNVPETIPATVEFTRLNRLEDVPEELA